MAGENAFPKDPGDILFASEVNRFPAASGLSITSFDLPIGGSFLIGTGSLTNPCSFRFVGKSEGPAIAIQFSGTVAGDTGLMTTDAGGAGRLGAVYDGLLPTFVRTTKVSNTATPTSDGNITGRYYRPNVFVNPGSEFVLFVGGSTIVGSHPITLSNLEWQGEFGKTRYRL